MKRLTLLALLCAALAAGCSWAPWNRPRVQIDWIDFIKWKGILYESVPAPQGRPITEADVGQEHGQVKFQVAGNVDDPGYKNRDGDAAFLAPGTKIYQMKGYSPTFRLLAMRDGKWFLYEAYNNPQAKTGADYLDLAGKLDYIVVRSMVDHSPVAEIRDRALVDEVAAAVAGAPLAARDDQSGTASENRYGLSFVLADGTSITRTFWPDTGYLWPGIKLPQRVAAIVTEAMK